MIHRDMIPSFDLDLRGSPLALTSNDPDFIAPVHLATEVGALLVTRNDDAFVALLQRAWRSGAGEDLLQNLLGLYASGHGLDVRATRTLLDASRSLQAHGRSISRNVIDGVRQAMSAALMELDCDCPTCRNQIAARN
jgi:hypothetical protein